MAERNTKKPRTRFKTVVSILIAAVTVAGAMVTWRISAAGGKAEAADVQGLTAALNSANTAIAVSTYLSNNLNFYISYRQHLAAADLLEKQARVSVGAKRSGLMEAARRERNMAATSRGYVDADYLEFDPSDGREYFNGNRYWEAQMASERALKPLDEKPFFDSADRMREKARELVDVTIALSAALFLFVAAAAVRRRVKYLFAVAATLVFLLACTAAIMIEISH